MSQRRCPRESPYADEYAAIEQRIHEYAETSRRLRAELYREFDPGYLYVAEFDSGVVKVGKARDADSRLRAHGKTGLVVSSWSSAYHLYCSKTERRLIAFCNDHATLYGGREYFRDITFDAASDYAARVVHHARCRLYLDDLIEAAGGNMGMTVAEANAALDALADAA